MNLSPIPKTPIRTPQSGTSNKNLQLTPIWESVVKSHKIPTDVNENTIFREISSRLEDLEWPVRQHAFRVLYDIIPITSKDRLDERIIENDILNKLVTNLGHPAPGVRKVAMETIRQYLKQTRYSEKMLESFVLHGLKEEGAPDAEDFGIIRENVILGTIISLVEILKPFIVPENGGYAVSQLFLNKIVAILSEKMKSPLYEEKCAESLWKIREMVGENRFVRTLEYLPDKTLLELIRTREARDKPIPDIRGSEAKSKNFRERSEKFSSFDESQDSDHSMENDLKNSVTTYHNYNFTAKNVADYSENGKLQVCESGKESTEEYSDGTDTDTYTKEIVNDQIDFDAEFAAPQGGHVQEDIKTTSFIPIEQGACPVQGDRSRTPDTGGSVPGGDKESLKGGDMTSHPMPSSPRVLLETEIQFSEDKAIKMRIVEDEKDSVAGENEIDLFPDERAVSRGESGERRFVTEDGDLIMKILHDNENEEFREEERKRTPRRVRFGGEVIKLRTPDSDATDAAAEAEGAAETEKAKQDSATGRSANAQAKPQNRPRPANLKFDAPGPKQDRTRVHEGKSQNQSHIPVPISPATKSPRYEESRNSGSAKRSGRSRSRSPPAANGKSSGEETSEKESAEESAPPEDGVDFWKWTDIGLVGHDVVNDLKNQEDWKIQYEALEELKVVLINPKVLEKIGKIKEDGKLASLFKCLLHKIPQSNNPQVTTLSISMVFQLIQTLPRDTIRRNLEDIVKGLCRYVGGCKNVNLKIESVQSLKMLFGIVEPSSVIDILLSDCLSSPNSKIRENSLLATMYATMTFPSDLFNVEKILERVANGIADSRRRVRHAALEALSVVAQFCSSETLTDRISRVAATLPNNITKTALISAVQARLSRRVLPTISNEGLVLYSLQIPASRRFGSVGNPSGADVDWILSGTGSVSTGSARSRGQLNAARRLDVTAPFSPSKWRSHQSQLPGGRCIIPESNTADRDSKKCESGNPWTVRKNRLESSDWRSSSQEKWKNRGNRFYRVPSTNNLTNSLKDAAKAKFSSSENLLEDKARMPRSHPTEYRTINAEDMSWALVPISSLEEQQLSRIRSNQIWSEFNIENGNQHIASPLGTLRPLYLKLQPAYEHISLSRSSDDLRRGSFSCNPRGACDRSSNEDFSRIRVLTPSILRERNRSDDVNLGLNPSTARTFRNEVQKNGGSSPLRIPPLQSAGTARSIQKPRSDFSANERKLADEPRGGSDGAQSTVVLLPNIHNHSGSGQHYDSSFSKSPQPAHPDAEECKIQETVTQLNTLLVASKNGSKSISATNSSVEDQPVIPAGNKFVRSEVILPLRTSESKKKKESSRSDALQHFQHKLASAKGNHPRDHAAVSAPAQINITAEDQVPSTSSSNSTEYGSTNGTALKLHGLSNGAEALNNNIKEAQKLNNNCNEKLKSGLSKSNKFSHKENLFPDNLKPFERPKEGLETCFNQLESQQWEVVMLGLTSLTRLLRHHPAIVLGQIHSIIIALARQIRNLRSQVTRAACQAAAEMFIALKRNIEVDLEELAGPLFHRSADTNRFIRLDCSHALDTMTDNVSPLRAVNVIISKGSKHQNAVVRAMAARLLLRLSEKIGSEKILSLPKETRDKVVQTGANFLMEGKLETRSYAKELFRLWSSHPGFSNVLLEAVPPNIMRNISKTLISLKT